MNYFKMEIIMKVFSCLMVLMLSIMYIDAKILPKPTTFDLYFDGTSRGQPMIRGMPHTFSADNFDTCKKTILLVTGFNQRDNNNAIIYAARMLAVKQYNTIVVNFETKEYFKATFKVGRDISNFLEYLTDYYHYDRDHITLFGISLGAHIAGATGRFFPGLGRILVVDPAGPFYDLFPKRYRITRKSAKYVDVLYSSKVLGSLRRNIGHTNFILNGGMFQPGCPLLEDDSRKPNVVCNHLRGGYLLLASLDRCEFRFSKCEGYLEYKLGLCDKFQKLAYGVGMDVEVAPRDGSFFYYDVTQLSYPFCTDTERVEPKINGTIPFC